MLSDRQITAGNISGYSLFNGMKQLVDEDVIRLQILLIFVRVFYFLFLVSFSFSFFLVLVFLVLVFYFHRTIRN